MDNKSVLGVVAGIVLVLGSVFGSGFALGQMHGTTVAANIVGAASPKPVGPQHFTAEAFLQGFTAGNRDAGFFTNTGALTTGGTVLSTSTISASFGTLTVAQLRLNRTIVLTQNGSGPSATTTLPTAALLAAEYPVAGQTTSWIFVNGTSTANRPVGIAAGSGIDLDAGTLNNVQIPTNGSAKVECTTISASSVRCRVGILTPGD